MSDVVAVIEGRTEKAFVDYVLAPHMGMLGIGITARLPGRVSRRGGARAWESVRGDILRLLKERRGRVCTTMFDFYALPDDWPGRIDASQMSADRKGCHVEQALLDDLVAHAGDGFLAQLFIPYVQVHEFEALMFADVAKLAKVLAPVCGATAGKLEEQFREVLDLAGEPEAINDSYETCPSRTISRLVKPYSKPVHGPIVAMNIGLGTLRKQCPHFGHWLARLESLAPAAPR